MSAVKPRRLTDMLIDKVSLVDRGANGRTFAILKQARPPAGPATFGQIVAVQKSAPTFAELLTTRELGSWLPSALEALGDVVFAALNAPDENGDLTPAIRVQAANAAVDEFAMEAKERIAGAIGKRHGQRVAKRPGHWARGIF